MNSNNIKEKMSAAVLVRGFAGAKAQGFGIDDVGLSTLRTSSPPTRITIWLVPDLGRVLIARAYLKRTSQSSKVAASFFSFSRSFCLLLVFVLRQDNQLVIQR